MIRGIYSATCSILNDDYSLNVDATIAHAASTINNGLHGAIFFGSTGQSQLISISEKKNLITKIANHKLKKQFFLGTGCNSLKETIDLIKYGFEYGFKDFLIMPPAYYKGNTDEGVFNFYSLIISKVPKIKIILYNFELLSGYKFSAEAVTKLVKAFPDNIIGCKDSTSNLFENLKLPNFLMFPGTEKKLLKGLEIGNSGIISAICNVTAPLARKVFDDFENKIEQTQNEKLVAVRNVFDGYNLISALHSYMSTKEENFKNLLPPLVTLNSKEKKDLIKKLNDLKFEIKNNLAA
ncbi:MAG: dihydrodipicolinate synthase family protein [Candidatus Pelagibacter sp. TMED272]|nr:dihydrodipicolinate synthase family protein [Pelagibacteraceae bacterium]RPG93466.1 MAG: dihydrodipicolinate synthase family protein [Candidatus Pelagibacter sp. TMED272]|tara:strand:- start:1169 stop:2050 length:882 start_codon:yes stop_codon:yes gene_type:complete